MFTYDVSNQAEHLIHEFAFNRLNRHAIHQLADMLITIFSVNDSSHKYILIDASLVEMLPLESLASGLREVVTRYNCEKFYIALVINEQLAVEATEHILKTILERKNVELFSDRAKAYLWLQLFM